MSEILNILTEAGPQEVAISPTKDPVPVADEGISVKEAAGNIPQPTAPGGGMSMPNMPVGNIEPTLQKTVINKELVLAVFSEFKSLIANYEKRFEKEEMGIEDASIYISNFLNSLSYNADKLADFIGAGKTPEMPEAPELPEMPPPPVAEEAPAPPTEEQPPVEAEGETGPGDIFAKEGSEEFTSPEAASL